MLMDMFLPKFDIYQLTVATQTLGVLILFKKMFCLISDLEFTFSNVTSFLLDDVSGLRKIIFRSVAKLKLSSTLLVPHAFTCRVLTSLFCKAPNQFLAVAKELMYSVSAILKTITKVFQKQW